MERKLVWILICTLISNSAYALIAPFLPLEFKDKGVSGEMIGIMFAIYSVAVIVCSPFVGRTILCVGNTNMISLGITTMGCAFILFGFIPRLDEMTAILTVGFILRFIQGASSAFVQTTCYSIATNEFPDQKEKVVGWVEAMTGLGLITGPIVGSTLYSLLGYSGTFFLYGSFLLVLSIVIKLNFPEHNQTIDDQEDDDQFEYSKNEISNDDFSSFKNNDSCFGQIQMRQFDLFDAENQNLIKTENTITLWKLLSSARFTMAALSSALCYFVCTFLEPILASRLIEFNLSSMQIGLFFAIWPIFYIPSSIAIQYVPRWVDKRFTIILASFLTFVAFIFVGPSEIFNLPNSLLIMGIGQALIGIFTAFMMIPGLPEMVESTIPLYPGQEREINDLSSGIYNSFLGFGQVIAPAYGSFVSEAIGFRMTSDIVAILCLVFAISYFFLAGGLAAFRMTCKRQKVPSKEVSSDDFFRLRAENEKETLSDTVSRRSYVSSIMIGPTTPAVAKMRVQNKIIELAPERYNFNQPGSPVLYPGSPLINKKYGMMRHRLYSDEENDNYNLIIV